MTVPIPLNLSDDAHARLQKLCAYYKKDAEYIITTLLWQASIPPDDEKLFDQAYHIRQGNDLP